MSSVFEPFAEHLHASSQRALQLVAGVEPLAVEACWRVPPAPPEIVVGFEGARRDVLMRAVEQVAPAHRVAVERWLAALPQTTDVGFKVGPRACSLQVYARGTYSAEQLCDAFAAADVICTPVVVGNGLRVFDQHVAVMAGLEVRDEVVGGAVYGSVVRTRETAQAIEDALWFLTTALAPAAAEGWRAIAPVLLDAPGEEIVYFSFAPLEVGGWVKLDVGERSLAAARRVLESAGHADSWPAIVDQVSRHRVEQWSHLGVRFDATGTTLREAAALVLYQHLR